MQFSRKLFFFPIFLSCILVMLSIPKIVIAGGLDNSNNLIENSTFADTVPQSSQPSNTGSPSDHFFADPDEVPFMLQNPGNLRTEIHYDPATNSYYKITRVGDRIVGWPRYIEFNDFLQYDMDRSLRRFWDTKARGTETSRGSCADACSGAKESSRLLNMSYLL